MRAVFGPPGFCLLGALGINTFFTKLDLTLWSLVYALFDDNGFIGAPAYVSHADG